MSERTLTFGGIVIPAHIASNPHIIRPARKMTSVKVAGTNREIVDMEDAWECYNQPYSLYIGDGSQDSIQEALDDIAKALYQDGWQVLEDDYDPEHFRLAYYQGGFDADNRDTRLSKFDVSFRCRPERFLHSGNAAKSIASGGTITNPTSFKAKPLIHIIGSGSGTLTVAGTQMTFTDIVDYLNVDCDKMDVYRLPSENRNNLMSGSFPVLPSGNSTILFTGGITGVTITPRWYVI